MPLHLPQYDVLIEHHLPDLPDSITQHRLTILHADQLHAEQSAPRYGVHDLRRQPLEWSTIVCWSAARRTGVFAGEYPEFRAACQLLQPVEDDEPLDPTQPEDGTHSPSSSPASTAASTSGSAPTSTTD